MCYNYFIALQQNPFPGGTNFDLCGEVICIVSEVLVLLSMQGVPV